MQQGWMFFGIGITMAILQGGWVRKIPPARTANTATMVHFFCLITIKMLLYINN